MSEILPLIMESIGIIEKHDRARARRLDTRLRMMMAKKAPKNKMKQFAEEVLANQCDVLGQPSKYPLKKPKTFDHKSEFSKAIAERDGCLMRDALRNVLIQNIGIKLEPDESLIYSKYPERASFLEAIFVASIHTAEQLEFVRSGITPYLVKAGEKEIMTYLEAMFDPRNCDWIARIKINSLEAPMPPLPFTDVYSLD